MSVTASPNSSTSALPINEQLVGDNVLASDQRYTVRVAENSAEIMSAFRLRHQVFHQDMGVPVNDSRLEFDAFDFRSDHLIAIERSTGRTIGTYRINFVSSVGEISSLYSHAEFELGALPANVIENAIEIGRACISTDHRNSRALFLLWKGLAKYLAMKQKRYVFGCCSLFTRDAEIGAKVYLRLSISGHIHPEFRVVPRKNAIDPHEVNGKTSDVELPHLFDMYLRLGAKICGPPIYDEAFGSIDFFVLFDLENMNDRYRRIFFN